MSDTLIVIAIIVGIALIAVIYIETREYRKYVQSAKALTAFGEGMKIIIESMGENMGRFSAIQTALTLDAEEKDSQIKMLNQIVTAHTEILSLKLLGEIAKAVTEDAERG